MCQVNLTARMREALMGRSQTMKSNPAKGRGTSEWPYASLFFFGFFGSDTKAGRLLAWRSTAALLVFVIAAMVLGGAIPQPLPDIVWVLAMPGAVGAIGWAYARYLETLDELGRLIQLKACAVSYGAAMVFAFALIAVGFARPGLVDAPLNYLPFIALVEVVRGVALVHLARAYE